LNWISDPENPSFVLISFLSAATSGKDFTGRDFQQVYAVNIFGTVAVTEAIRPLINNGGTIINVSSGLGSMDVYTKKPAPPIALAYSSSKAALNSLTVQWALQEEQLGSGIRVVCICPGKCRPHHRPTVQELIYVC
jgi:NAD(P)-dependent dehydrogenase (short-subunit alcohol dehydrogenase family)